MKLYAFHAGGEKLDMAVFDPLDSAVGTKVVAPWFFYFITHPEGNVLFDTSGHPDLISDPHARLGAAADLYEIKMDPGDDVVSSLARIDVAPQDVDHVVLSHLHYDHAGGIEFFPHATFYAQREELSFAHWPPVYQRPLYIRADFDHPVRWKELTGEYDLFSDGRVLIFPTPGHSRGHQSLLLRFDDRAIILVGDAAYQPWNMEKRVLPGVVWSPDAMVASWEYIEEMQRRHRAELIFTHDLEFEKRTKLAPDEWYE